MQGTPEEPGIIPRAVEKLLKVVNQREKQFHKSTKSNSPFEVTVSYLEIYNEKVYDLLVPQPEKEDLPVREDQNKNIFIANLTSLPIQSFDDFQKTYVTGCKNRSVAATKLNSKSSRSHAILLVRVTMKDQETKKKITGKLHLIDLAGK